MTDQETIATLRTQLRKAEEELKLQIERADGWSAQAKKAEEERDRRKVEESAIRRDNAQHFACNHPFLPVGFEDGSWRCCECWAEKAESELAEARKRLAAALGWLEKATRGEEGQDWDDVFMARDELRQFLAQQEAPKP